MQQLLASDWQLMRILVDLVGVWMVQNSSGQLQIAVKVGFVETRRLDSRPWQEWLWKYTSLNRGIFDLSTN